MATGRRVFSFEFFPPKTDAGRRRWSGRIRELRELAPAFVSVTYGAGGSTRDRDHRAGAAGSRSEAHLTAMAHLTCVGAGRAEIGGVLDRLVGAGIENVMALRGDPPAGQERRFETPADGFAHASDLVGLHPPRIRRSRSAWAAPPTRRGTSSAAISTAISSTSTARSTPGWTSSSPSCSSTTAVYFDFVARARAAGITVPIVPGIMPIPNLARIERMTKLCGRAASLRRCSPSCDRRRDDAAAIAALGVAQATAQCVELLHGGAPGIHFYTLNQSPATRVILTALKGARLG